MTPLLSAQTSDVLQEKAKTYGRHFEPESLWMITITAEIENKAKIHKRETITKWYTLTNLTDHRNSCMPWHSIFFFRLSC